MRNSKQHLFTVVFVGCLWLVLILGCTQLKEISNSGQTPSPATSPTNAATTSSATNNSQTNTSIPASTAGVTIANYDRLQNGMTYAEVVKILGKEGKRESVMESGGTKIEMYKWDGDGGGSDARLDAFFKNGKLDHKSQFALK